jgi:hypothetical protein
MPSILAQMDRDPVGSAELREGSSVFRASLTVAT